MEIDQFITEATALLAKHKGFDWPSPYILWDDNYHPSQLPEKLGVNGKIRNSQIADKLIGDNEIACTVTTQTDLQKWLRLEHNIHVYIKPTNACTSAVCYVEYMDDTMPTGIFISHFQSYEQTLELGLVAALKLIN
jgi:hypothetical protein